VVIGEEGNGKSTLLKSLIKTCDYSKMTGIINFNYNTVGYLEQSVSEENLSKKVFDFLFVDDFDYYDKVHRLYKQLDVLKLDDSILKRVINTLSGGEKVKIGLLKLLLNEYDILFLDEPTNDLDIETLIWLENFIKNTEKPIMYVSHDEALLSNTANMILHLEQIKKKTDCRYTLLKMDYHTYVNWRGTAINKQIQMARSEKRDLTSRYEKLRKVM